jgi:hypothetical protein
MKHRRGARIGVAVLAAVLCALALATPAAAHVKSGAPATSAPGAAPLAVPVVPAAALPASGPAAFVADGGAPLTPWLTPLLLAAALLAWRRPRRAAALALVLVLAACAFESGVHSVHHLGAPDRGRDCAIASAAAHLPADTGAALDVAPALADSIERAASPDAASLRSLARSPARGRAPPVLPA